VVQNFITVPVFRNKEASKFNFSVRFSLHFSEFESTTKVFSMMEFFKDYLKKKLWK